MTVQVPLKLYTLEYFLHGNRWRISVLAWTLADAKGYASKAVNAPKSWFKTNADLPPQIVYENTFDRRRVI